jgi:hypothetical protein
MKFGSQPTAHRAVEEAIVELKLVPRDGEFVLVSRALDICFGDSE